MHTITESTHVFSETLVIDRPWKVHGDTGYNWKS